MKHFFPPVQTPQLSKLLLGLAVLLGSNAYTAPAQAAAGMALSAENLFAPLGKEVEQRSSDGGQVVPGRQTTEWVGVTGFYDLNRNWRLLGGAHGSLLQKPIFKLDAGIAFMLEMPDKVPVQPYIFVGATPVIATDPAFPPLGINMHGGLGLDYNWDNALYTSIRLQTYFFSLYGEEKNAELNLAWNSVSFSLSAAMGFFF